MRTTLTLDADIWMRLKELAEERSVSFEEILNSTLRAGLAASPLFKVSSGYWWADEDSSTGRWTMNLARWAPEDPE